MPFVIILSITGAIYLFKPQLDAWADRQFDHLDMSGQAAPISAQVKAACDAFPGAIPTAYELPARPDGAGRVIMQDKGITTRVFVHPVSLQVLGSRINNGGFVRQVRSFHGQLGLGEKGSYVVELAASWTIIMVLTGLCLWWPRNVRGIGGVLYPRTNKGSKVLLRDLHSVTGFWISVLVLFLLATGLPWAKFWGNYFRSARALVGVSAGSQDWTIGGGTRTAESKGHEGHSGGSSGGGHMSKSSSGRPSREKRDAVMPNDLTCFDRVAATAVTYNLLHPATIEPPGKSTTEWIAKSDTQNRPYRMTLKIDPTSGELVSKEDFSSRAFLDQLVSIGIAAHEGQLFGWPNQLLGLITALGLIVLCISGYILWWKRKDAYVLGAPAPLASPKLTWALTATIIALAIYLPLFGASLICVAIVEHTILRRFSKTRTWLGLR